MIKFTKLLFTIFAITIAGNCFAQCRFVTHTFASIAPSGEWTRYHSKEPIILDYWFNYVKIIKPDEYFHINKLEEIIDEYPVQKMIFKGWFVMVSNVNICDWIGVANDDGTLIFINNEDLKYDEIVRKF